MESKFIELHARNGQPFLVNTSGIQVVQTNGDLWLMGDNTTTFIQETYEQVKKLIEDAND